MKKWRPPAWLVSVVLSLAVCEVTCQVVYRWQSPSRLWVFQEASDQHKLFERHPFLAVALRPGVRVRHWGKFVAHNSAGFRGPELRVPNSAVRRIVTLGGSSTYCVRVSNDETWPHYLQADLGERSEVINLGVPGYSTAEHVIQTALVFSALHPNMALYYVGWNDLRNTHVKNLDPYYARFHGRSQLLKRWLDGSTPGSLASVFYAGRVVDLLGGEEKLAEGDGKKFTLARDEEALALYRRNLTLISALCHAQNVRVVFVPQVLNCKRLAANAPSDWIPFLRGDQVCAVLERYNTIMRDVATDQRDVFAASILGVRFADEDFVDEGHFSSHGNQLFAAALTEALRRL
jgi:lysophospholipase L1-like esterase